MTVTAHGKATIGKDPLVHAENGRDHAYCTSVLLFAVTALAAMALTAPSVVSAIEIKTEPNPGAHCGATVTLTNHAVSGGCGLHAAHTESFTAFQHNPLHTSETGLMLCLFESEARISESGQGYYYSQVLSDCAPQSCPFEPCKENGTGPTEPWQFGIQDLGATERLELTYCVQAKGSGVEGSSCTLHVPITKVGHVYTFNAEPDIGCEEVGDERELRTRWKFEQAGEAAHTNIEIVNT